MALPVINAPTFNVKLHSTGKTVKVRAYNVGEEKQLLGAMRSPDSDFVEGVLKNVISACTFGEVDIDTLPTYDLEHLFLQIRANAADPFVVLAIPTKEKCPVGTGNCKCTVQVDLREVHVKVNENHSRNVTLTEHVAIKMNYPTMKALEKYRQYDPEEVDQYDVIIDMIITCMDSVYTPGTDKVQPCANEDVEELKNFIKQLGKKHLKLIMEFFNTMPMLQHDFTATCEDCGKEVKSSIRGMRDFLA